MAEAVWRTVWAGMAEAVGGGRVCRRVQPVRRRPTTSSDRLNADVVGQVERSPSLGERERASSSDMLKQIQMVLAARNRITI